MRKTTPKRIKNRLNARKPIRDAMRMTGIPNPRASVRLRSLKGLSSGAKTVNGKRTSMSVTGVKSRKPKDLKGAYAGIQPYNYKQKKSHLYDAGHYKIMEELMNKSLDPNREDDEAISNARLATELDSLGLAGHHNNARRAQSFGETLNRLRGDK